MPSRDTLVVSDTILFASAQRGVARYFELILKAMVETFGERVVYCSPVKRSIRPAKRIPVLRLPRRVRLNQLLQDSVASFAAAGLRARVFYSPYYGNALTAARQVFTVYDMIDELLPAYADRRRPAVRRLLEEKRRCIERAALLFCISQNTANDVLRCFPELNPAKIVVTPLGVEPAFFEEAAPPSGLQTARPYFLYVGHRARYKNFLRLLEAYGESGLAAGYDLRVIAPVPRPWTNAETALMQRFGLAERIQLTVAPSDRELAAYYAAAHAFVYPSEYEGFGLPVLEAMASGTLVLASQAGAIPEVAGAPALYIDPLLVGDIAACLRASTQLSEGDRFERIAQGRARARTFTWARCQEQTVTALQQLFLDSKW